MDFSQVSVLANSQESIAPLIKEALDVIESSIEIHGCVQLYSGIDLSETSIYYKAGSPRYQL